MDLLAKTFEAALSGVDPSSVIEAARRFTSGEVEGQSEDFAPSCAKFVKLCRKIEKDRKPHKPHIPQYRLTHPDPRVSKLLAKDITKDKARQLVENGAAPRGSIWIPGPMDDETGHTGKITAYGALWSPDPDWEFDHTDIHLKKEPVPPVIESPEARVRMKFKLALWSKAWSREGGMDLLVAAQKTGRMDELIALAQAWGVPVPETVWAQKDHVL
jgi:hypothetical protein